MNVEQKARELHDLIDRYWDLAYIEGKEGRSSDTEDGKAQQLRLKIDMAINAIARALEQPEGREAVAWLYTLEYGGCVANTKVSKHQLRYPFGVCGSDYLARNDEGVSYVRETPLYTTPPPSAVPEGLEIVGHKTFDNGRGGFRHEPLTRAEADALIARCRSEDERRKALMPDEKSALRMMMDAYTRLKDMGWNDAVYCPKDGRTFEVIEPGSTGIHSCIYTGEWPTGSWWVFGNGDMYPSRPILFRNLTAAHQQGADRG